MRVGLIEDNADYRTEVVFHLRRAGLDIVLENDGVGIDAQLADCPCDVLLLDLGLPVEDGLVIARRLRQQRPGLGIVMLTARGSLDDRLIGLEEGADAYLVKPVDMREIVATLRSVERRLAANVATASLGVAPHWTLHLRTLTLTSPEARPIKLSLNEVKLLKQLGAARGAPVSRRDLAHAIGYPNPDFDDRRLEVAFSRLRQKIEAVEPDSTVIRAARNKGYFFAAELQDHSAE
jgi:DNA-binding response OmpR family regulator